MTVLKGLMLADRRGWAFDLTARELTKRLRDRVDLRVAYAAESPRFAPEDFDFVYVFWWGESCHLRDAYGRVPIIKEVSSERWRYDPRFRAKSDADAVRRFMGDATALVATSARIAAAMREVHPRVFDYRLGVDGAIFHPDDVSRRGDLVVGWAGQRDDPAKRFSESFAPAVKGRHKVNVATGELPLASMPAFYRGIDVFCVTSLSEGTPLPLLEAMASGCFPVSTRVGVAEELVRDGVDGLLIEPDVRSLRAALEWCDRNQDFVRQAGANNAKRIAVERSWDVSARGFFRVLKQLSFEPMAAARKPGYRTHFARINPGEGGEAVYAAQCISYEEEFSSFLPHELDARVLEIGPGYGHLIRWLREKGYTAIEAVEQDVELAQALVEGASLKGIAVHAEEATSWLSGGSDRFQIVILCDVIEHLPKERALLLLKQIHSRLEVGGRVLMRTPNMASLLGGYSRYIDLTHETGFTEWSLLALLNEAGFEVTGILRHPRYASRRRRWRARLQRGLHRVLYRLDERTMPTIFAKNLVAWGQR